MKQRIKRALFGLLGKDPEAVVVTIGAGELPQRVRALVPDRTHLAIETVPCEPAGELWLRLRRATAGRRVALSCVSTANRRALTAALLAFPGKVLAFHPDGERHHLRLTRLIASMLFSRGLPLDRIFLRPSWLFPWKRDASVLPRSWRVMPGRPFRPGMPRVAVLSPYFPWPLSHGGAVRIYHLLREASRDFDIVLFAFEDGQAESDFARIAEFCPLLGIAAKPRYREPRWSSLLPPEACEFHTPELAGHLRELLHQHQVPRLQVEYTQMARYGGDVLVEHDVTWDLFEQVHRAEPSLSSWWNLFRWRRFERGALRRFPAIVAMSAKDAALIDQPGKTTVIPNGVDLERLTPTPLPAAPHLLFIGSFRHFPNVRAYRFFVEEVWPRLRHRELRVTVVAGPDPQLYWPHASPDPRIALHGFVADVQPLYDAASIVLIPTVVSAGTNLKALEAMAAGRAIVSTPSGVAGLGLEDGRDVLIGETAEAFAACVERLLNDPPLAAQLAANARAAAEANFGWPALARLQGELWNR